MDEVIAQNERLQQENEILRQQQNNVNYQVQQAVQAETGSLMNQLNELKEQLIQNASGINGNGQNTGIDTSNGTPLDNPLPINGMSVNNPNQTENINGMSWVAPSDMQAFDDRGNLIPLGSTTVGKMGFPTDFNKKAEESKNLKKGLPFIGDSDDNMNATGTTSRAEKKITPFYTIPANSTLTNSIAMTALVGRIPINNNVTEPYPFKLLIGRDNLIANGIELPDIEGAIISGTATGDWTLSCVRGDVKSMTFVFSDGRIVSTDNGQEKLGWLSDPHGVPCIPGERKTNAPEYLTTNFLLAGAATAAQGMAQSQTTTVVDGSAVVGAVTGDNGKYILGQALGGGLRETAEWFRQRYGQTFDAVYVPPGHELAVHIDKELLIDYDRTKRKVKYGQSAYQSRLD